MEGVHLRAVSWHEGKRDKKTEQIVRKNFVGSFPITVEGRPHRKRRWVKEDDGSTTETFYDVKRPRLVTEYCNTSTAPRRSTCTTPLDRGLLAWSVA